MPKKLEKLAATCPCDVIMHPTEPYYVEKDIRLFQGIATVAVTRGGRIFVGWYAGGYTEPHPDNFNILAYSDDGGKTWTNPLLVIPSSRLRWIHAFDIQCWIAPDGRLFVYWVQQNMEPIGYGREGASIAGWFYDLQQHFEWCMVCEDPDAEELVFSEPRCVGKGFLRNKPVVLQNGSWMSCNYDLESDRYAYSISKDQGKTFQRGYAGVKFPTPFDETMAYQKKDGSIRMLARTSADGIAECISFDNGETWTETRSTGINNPNTRFYIGRTPSGRVLLVNNDHPKDRTNMTLYLSEDDGETWAYKRCIDTRPEVTYPDVDFHDGKIYLTYDRGRYDVREVLLAVFTEEDIIHPENPIDIQVIVNSEAEPTPKADRDGKPYRLSEQEQGRYLR